MSPQGKIITAGLLLAGMLSASLDFLEAQQPDAKKKKLVISETGKELSDVPNRVVINREAPRLIDPKKYRVPLQLEAWQTVKLAAVKDGIVRSVHLRPGAKVDSQTEAVRLENTEEQLLLERAKANYRVTQIEVKRAKSQGETDLVELAEMRLKGAKAELDLAEYRLAQTGVRVPFGGEVFRVYVVAGQYVRAGEPLMTFGDTSKMKVEVPVDRTQMAVGKMMEIRVEETTTKAKVDQILPLDTRFEPLRDLVNSLASAIVVFDNADGRFKAGQAVFVPLIPRQWIAEVSTSCLANLPEAGNESGHRRKLQVVRQNVVRDIRVQLHGQMGTDRIYVSGPFQRGDEVITGTSHDLPDGTRIRPGGVASAPSSQSNGRPPDGKAAGAKRNRGAF